MKAALAAVAFYRRFVSPLIGRHCRFEPSCSEYLSEALEKRGLVPGFALGLGRLLHCHPFSAGGWDPVPGGDSRLGPRPWPGDHSRSTRPRLQAPPACQPSGRGEWRRNDTERCDRKHRVEPSLDGGSRI